MKTANPVRFLPRGAQVAFVVPDLVEKLARFQKLNQNAQSAEFYASSIMRRAEAFCVFSGMVNLIRRLSSDDFGEGTRIICPSTLEIFLICWIVTRCNYWSSLNEGMPRSAPHVALHAQPGNPLYGHDRYD